MSAQVLQRVVVRMLHDAELRARVLADPDLALAGLELDAAERRMLLAPDRRAWGVDVHRAERVLTVLLEELPVSALALLEEGVPLSRCMRFFQSAFFHDAIMGRASLAPAFADHLMTLATSPRVSSVIALEGAVARLRRSASLRAARPPHTLVLSPRARPVALLAGTLAAWDRARKALGPEPVAKLLAPSRPRIAPVDARRSEHVLLEMPEDEPVAGFIGEALERLLEAAMRPVSRDVLLAIAEREGASPAEAAEIIDELIADGLLLA